MSKATVKTTMSTVTLGFDACVDGNNKPLCACATAGFRCRALRPKTYNARGDLVHYCGLGEPGQLPLLETSVKQGIVRPRKNKCYLHQEAERTAASVSVSAPSEKVKPLSTLHQVGYFSALDLHVYVDTREFCGADIEAMESDISMLGRAFSRGTPLETLIRELCTLVHPHYQQWRALFFYSTDLGRDVSMDVPGLRVTKAKTWDTCMHKTAHEISKGLKFWCVGTVKPSIRHAQYDR